MTAFFWAGFRMSLRRNTCADRLKLVILMWPAQTAAIFFDTGKSIRKAY